MTTTIVWPLLLTLLLIVPMVLLLDVWLVRLAWQTATRDLHQSDDLPPQKEPPPFRTAENNQRWIVLLIVFAMIGLLLLATTLAFGVLGAYWLMPLPSKPAAPIVVQPQFRTMEAITPPEQVTGPARIEGEPAKRD